MFDELNGERIDKININFSSNGRFFVLYSLESNFFWLYEIEDSLNGIRTILKIVREGRILLKE